MSEQGETKMTLDDIKNNREDTMEATVAVHVVQKSIDEIVVEQLFESGFLTHQDKRNLMMTKEAYRNAFYNCHKNMKNMLINIKEPFEIHNLRSLLKKFGSFIKNISINTDMKLKDSLRYVSKYCKKMKKLSIKSRDYKIDSKYTNNITDLNQLHISLTEMSDENAVQKLISNKKSLKRLSLEVESSIVGDILLSNSENIESSLNEFSYSVKSAEYDNVREFLKNQKSLEKLVIGNNLPDDLFNIQHTNEDENVFLKIESLKQFKDRRNITNVNDIKNNFEFITTLKAVSINVEELTFLRLHTLKIDNARFHDLKNLFLPLLKVLKIKKLPYCDGYFDEVMHSINSVETFIIESVKSSVDIEQIVSMLKFFPNLQKFALRHGRSLNSKYNMEDNERIEAKKPFYKIVVDNAKKEVKVSSYIVRNCDEILLSLQTTFQEFQFKEFCFDDSTLRTQNITIHERFRFMNVLENVLESFKPSCGFYSDISGSAAIKNAIFGNMKSLTIPGFPVDFNGGKVMKFSIECMNLDFLQCKSTILISDKRKNFVGGISVSGNQISSLYEMLRQYNISISTVKLTLSKTEIDFDQIDMIRNNNRELFDRIQSLEINDESGSNVLFGGFLGFIKKFRNIKTLKITTRDRSIDIFLNDLLPGMICLEEFHINARTLRLTDRLNSIHDNARRLQNLWINSEYVQQSTEFFSQHNSMVEVYRLD